MVMIKNEEEIWKKHPDYAWIEVSTFGNVRTLDRVVPCGVNGTRLVKGKDLKQWYSGDGYLNVCIQIEKKQANKLVHRLVAQTFIPNPDNLPEINHLDCDRANNNVDNLEWCTRSYNMKYKEKYGISNTELLGHHLFAINLTTLKVSHFCSQHEASRALGVNVANINMVIKGKRNQAGGFWFVTDAGHAVDVVKSKLHDIGRTGLKIYN